MGGILDGERFEFSFKNDFVGQCWTNDSLSEAMWGIYTNDSAARYLRIRSTPRKLLSSLQTAHPAMTQDTCFIGKVEYKREDQLMAYAENGGRLNLGARRFAEPLLLKRHAFRHESEVRRLYLGDASTFDDKGLYRYEVDPHARITQIMADPNRDRANWLTDKAAIAKATGFACEIKRSKIYDAPEWDLPEFTS
jgi:hypothetical protein